MNSNQWNEAVRIAHLIGGLRAFNKPGPDVEFSPRLSQSPKGYSLAKYGDLHGSLENGGLKIIGIEFFTHQHQIKGHMPSDWRPYHWCDGHDPAPQALTLWSQLTTGGHEEDNFEFADLCGRIHFQIQACTWRLFDISQAYNRELEACVAGKDFCDGTRFETMNSLFIYLGVHSFFSEAATLRDYLAEFISAYPLRDILNTSSRIRLMSKLRKAITKLEIGSHKLADEVSKITNENSSSGWLARMSAYRDLAVHYTPLTSAKSRGFLKQKILRTNEDAEFPTIYFPLPDDPFEIKKVRSKGVEYQTTKEWIEASVYDVKHDSGNPDALEYCHYALGQLASFALGVGEYSPIQPEIPSFTEKDLHGPIIVKRD